VIGLGNILSPLIGPADYVFQWAIVLPLELVVAGFTVGYWNPDINVGVWITVFLIAIVIINVFGVLGFAEEEFWSSILKLAAVVIFMIVGLILGEPYHPRFKGLADQSLSMWWWPQQRHL
jgi:amino acid permease